jgi:thiol:disulfide interchange protein
MERFLMTVRLEHLWWSAAKSGVMMFALGMLVTLTSCDRQADPTARPPQTPSMARTAPSSSGKTLEPVLLSDVKKIIAQAKADQKILVIDFWATWCLPCVEMFPQLHEKLPAISPRVRVVTVTLDAPGKYEARAVDFLREHDALENAYRIGGSAPDWEALIAGLGKQWQDLQVPAILVYNEQGELVDEFINERAKPELIIARVKEMADLAQAPSR